MLLQKHGRVLGKKASHTTRPPREGEVDGIHYYFVNREEYDRIRDSDDFLELNNFNGNDYGTSRKVVDGIIEKGKVPVMEMDMHGIQQLKDQGYAARFIFLAPPEMAELEQRLRRRGSDDEDKVKARLQIAIAEIAHSKVEGFHDKIIINDDLQATYATLEKYIFDYGGDDEAPGDGEKETLKLDSMEVEMTDEVLAADFSKTEAGVAPEAELTTQEADLSK